MMVSNCAAPACNNAAGKLQCPTCIKLKLHPTFYCSQTCFKGNWSVHKVIHSLSKPASDPSDPFPDFPYTGELRAVYPLSEWRTVPDHIAKPDYAENGIPIGEMETRGSYEMKILNQEEKERVAKVCKLAREVLDIAGAAVKPGITTDEIDRIVHEACIERNSYPSPLNYHGFPKSCCTSVNEVICHGIPDKYVLKEGDLCNIDVTLYHDGYHGDMNETFFVGKPDGETEKLVTVTHECLEKAIAMVRPGTLYRSIGDVIQRHASKNNLSVVRTYCGHGIHELFHTVPNVPHYSKNKAIGVMKAGHCFTIEPMICIGTFHDKTWPDDWTSVTADGMRSAQFEHQLLVTETGCEILSANVGGIPGFKKQLKKFNS